MITTIYKCDRCEKTQENGNQFWTVSVTVLHYGSNQSFTSSDKFIQVCRECLEELGIHRQERPLDERPPAPSIEDLIKEIISRCKED